jgi:hypothetical protein
LIPEKCFSSGIISEIPLKSLILPFFIEIRDNQKENNEINNKSQEFENLDF